MDALSETVEELWGVVCDGSSGPLMSTKFKMTPPLWMVLCEGTLQFHSPKSPLHSPKSPRHSPKVHFRRQESN